MRELTDELTGPWAGFSVQDGLRITESLQVVIRGGSLSGVGSDIDGDFEIAGSYHARSGKVHLTRRYTYTTEPSQMGVGIAYDYEGTWDGLMVSGRWHPRSEPSYGGPFEMWPFLEEDERELAIEQEELELTLPGRGSF